MTESQMYSSWFNIHLRSLTYFILQFYPIRYPKYILHYFTKLTPLSPLFCVDCPRIGVTVVAGSTWDLNLLECTHCLKLTRSLESTPGTKLHDSFVRVQSLCQVNTKPTPLLESYLPVTT